MLEEVPRSTACHHPILLSQITGRATAEGKVLESQGAFEFRLNAVSGTNSLGHNKTRTVSGGNWQPQRRLGGEIFEPWKEAQLTLSRGKRSGGIEVPLLRNLRSD
ncbi:MAG: hypothetical protein OXN89_03600 [Bryobacterales bacterium]|nr:hypothetical protein [Bryobacterales bacterium]